jgi:hypothetical protein
MNKYIKQALDQNDNIDLDGDFLLIAGPSSGKSTLIKKYPDMDIMDSDLVIESLAPSWWSNHEQSPSDATYELLAYMIRAISAASRTLWLTNIWGKLYLDILVRHKREKIIFVYREDPVEIQSIFARLGKRPVELSTLKEWVASHKQFAHLVTKHVVALKNGQYLSDVVKPTSDGWRLF